MYRNPEGTLPGPRPHDIPVPFWQQTKTTFEWVETPLDPVMFSPAGRRFTFAWHSPIFDLRPELRAAQGEVRGGVPIQSRAARLYVQVFGLNNADATSGSAAEHLSASVQDYGNAQVNRDVTTTGIAPVTTAGATSTIGAPVVGPASPVTFPIVAADWPLFNVGDTVVISGGGNTETAVITALPVIPNVTVDFLQNNYPAGSTFTRVQVTGGVSLVAVSEPSSITNQIVQPGAQASSAVAVVSPVGTSAGGGDGYPMRFWQARVSFSKVILDADYPNGVPPTLSLAAVMY
jgi:hypothetical protein